jgi:predicted nucleic acid-binding protein
MHFLVRYGYQKLFQTIGSLGVLLQAKRAGLIPAIAPLLTQIAASPVFIGAELLQTVLDLAGE